MLGKIRYGCALSSIGQIVLEDALHIDSSTEGYDRSSPKIVLM